MSETWEEENVTRLMCWAHTSRAIDRSQYLADIRKLDKKVSAKIMEDLYLLQWSVPNEKSFLVVFSVLELNHSYPSLPELDTAVKNFFNT